MEQRVDAQMLLTRFRRQRLRLIAQSLHIGHIREFQDHEITGREDCVVARWELMEVKISNRVQSSGSSRHCHDVSGEDGA